MAVQVNRAWLEAARETQKELRAFLVERCREAWPDHDPEKLVDDVSKYMGRHIPPLNEQERIVADEIEEKVAPYRWHQCLVGIPILLMMAYAAFAGFIFAGLRYGFNSGIEIFDEFFETESAKGKKK